MTQWRITNRTYVTGPEPNQGEGPCGDEARRGARGAFRGADAHYALLYAVAVQSEDMGDTLVWRHR